MAADGRHANFRRRSFAPRYFPPPQLASHEGIVGVGGSLDPEWLLDAYSHGIFPWPTSDDAPLIWWSPDPRAVIEFDRLHVSQRLRRTLRSTKFQTTSDTSFEQVIRACATTGDRQGESWITPKMIKAYVRLHELGYAHCVEAWHQGELVGGVYGVAIGGLFAAESMFHTVSDASKVALVHLVHHLKGRGYGLLDIQQWTPHTGRLGASEIPRDEYLRRLAVVREWPVDFGKLEQAES